MRRKPGLGLARDGSVGKAGGATFARLSSSSCWTFLSGIFARNQIEGTVVKVQEGAVNGHVTIEDEEGVRISGSITNESIESLGLKEGGKAVAIIKATDVMVAVD